MEPKAGPRTHRNAKTQSQEGPLPLNKSEMTLVSIARVCLALKEQQAPLSVASVQVESY